MSLARIAPRLFFVGVIIAAAYLMVITWLLLTGPRMKAQPHVRAYDASMRVLPAGAIPVTDAMQALPTAEEAAALKNPLAPTALNTRRGGVYYRYYCLACHGEQGDGRGPVGEAYVPTPADLRSAKVQQRSDGQLYRAMLTGTNHAPVMEYTIPSEHRWYIVSFLRTFGTQASPSKGLAEAKINGACP